MKRAEPKQLTRPLQVLLVDDDDIFLDVTAYELSRLGCEVLAVDQPEIALEILRERDFDAVITDWQMPVIDGIELVRRARQDGGEDKFRYVVLTTARAQPETARAALEAGADDVLFKPLDPLQLELTIASIRRTVGLQRRLERHNRHLTSAHRRTREAYRRIEADIEAAATLHRGLLPRPQEHDRIDFAWSYMPAQSLGGDSIGVITLRSGATLFFVIDVRGHGVPAALASFHVHHRLVQLSPETPDDLVEAIATLNNEMAGQPDDTYCTLLCGLVNPQGSGGWMVRAGHPQPLVVKDGTVTNLQLDGSFPLGWFADLDYVAEAFSFPAEGVLVVYSDGVTDCVDSDGVPLEFEGLQAMFGSQRASGLHALVHHLETQLRTRCGRRGFEDDISILALSGRHSWEVNH